MFRAVTLAAWVLAAAGGFAVGQAFVPRHGLLGHYYDNVDRAGAPDAIVLDESISTDTLDNGTAGIWQSFSVEWTGAIVIPSAGTYRFATLSDDGSELDVDDQTVVRNGGKHGPQEVSGTAVLTAGIHPLRLRYQQFGGGFTLALKYAADGEPLREIPLSVLLPEPMSLGAYLARASIPYLGAALVVALCVLLSRARLRVPSLSWDPPASRALLIVVAVSVIARVLMMFGSNGILWGDSDVFMETFGAIRNGHFFEHDPFRTLLYPYFLTAFLFWSGEKPMDQIIIGAQHVLGVISAVAFFALARRAFNTRIALVAGVIFSLHTTQLFYENSVLSESFFVCVLSLSLLVFARYLRAPSFAGACATAMACLTLTMTRPIAQWYVLIPVGLGLLAARDWRRRIGYALTIVAIYGAALMPWAALNQRTYGFYGVAIGQGLGLFIRTFEIERYDLPANTRYPEVKDILAYGRATQYSPATYVRDELKRRRYSTAQADRMMNDASLEAIAQRPIDFALGSVRQWWRQLGGPLGDEQVCNSPEVGAYVCSKRTEGYAREPFLNRPRDAHQPLRTLVVAYFRHARIPMHVVSAFAGFAAVTIAAASLTEINWAALVIVLTAAYMTFLPAAAQFPQDRYRVPVDGLLFMLAVWGAAQLIQHLFAVRPPSASSADQPAG